MRKHEAKSKLGIRDFRDFRVWVSSRKSKFGVRTSKSGIFGIGKYGRMSTHSRGDNERILVG
ncbi:unnamed protein product [Meloidogyne enterolobii]|uniref:Uncharacterized protein n=1 Tax=Meloidogyne enterolobii TaxID=390850 RepID=A0ACB1B1F2_MELEN